MGPLRGVIAGGRHKDVGKIGGNDRDREKVAGGEQLGSKDMGEQQQIHRMITHSNRSVACALRPGRGSPKGQKSYP